jgi:hypothetical protein
MEAHARERNLHSGSIRWRIVLVPVLRHPLFHWYPTVELPEQLFAVVVLVAVDISAFFGKKIRPGLILQLEPRKLGKVDRSAALREIDCV